MKKIILTALLLITTDSFATTDVNITGIGVAVTITSPTFTGQVTVTSTLTVTGSNGGYGLQVSSGVNLAGLIYSNNGNVGIGDSTPSFDLDVVDDVQIQDQLIVKGTATVQGSAFSVGVSSFAVTNTNVRIGNMLGIGAYAPVDSLHIFRPNATTLSAMRGIHLQNNSGPILNGMVGLSFVASNDDSVTPEIILGVITTDAGGDGKSDFFMATRNSTTGSTAPTEKLRLTAAGLVGIGTNSPLELLDVAGGMSAYSRTIAQLLAIAPGKVGTMYFCNNCSPAKIVVSTGTSAGNFADVNGGTFQ